VRAKGERFNQEPVGTGPFRFVRWEQEQAIVLEANDAYWGGRPWLDRVVYEVIRDKIVRTLRFQSGEIHAFDSPGPSELQAVRAMPHVKILQQPGMNVGYLAMNCDHPPFDRVEVRQAVNHAIDKKRIVDDIYKGTGQVAKNPLPPSLWGHADDVEDFAHDPARARALLAEAGMSGGFTCSLWYMPIARPYMPDGKKVAEAIQLDLKAVGITAELVTYDWDTYLTRTKQGDHDMALLGWSGDNGDPDNFLNVLLSIQATTLPAQNIAFYRNAEFDGLIRAAKEELDLAKRAEIYRRAQHVFHADPAWVCLAHNLQTVVLRDDVEGYVLYPSTRKDFRRVSFGSPANPG
jgi:ABC-type transport system substrate-binding protein